MVASGTVIAVPSEPASACLVALHAGQHGHSPGTHLTDLDRALIRAAPSTWRLAAAIAGELGARAEFAGGLRPSPHGAALADDLGLDTLFSRPGTLLSAHGAWGIEQIAARRGVVPRLRLIGQKLVPSTKLMRTRYPKISRFRGGVLAAHVVRLARLCRDAPAAIGSAQGPGRRAWLRADAVDG